MRRHEQVTLKPFEATVDLFLTHNLFNCVDRRGMALGDQTCAFSTMQLLHLTVTIVVCVREMRSAAACHTATDHIPFIEDDHRSTFLREQISGGHSRDTGADYADVGTNALLQSRL